ncbi:assimilatory sulfite reductase (NADPH) flavoprotein subunit [Buchnera aphidicola (Thelaxes californica)]|uniref:Sulfite reductase [NADPH] flavoprotein alpha-component n=1 Tax=Buchnera aphidicola (Thelaxes californica) TaxID=1315998 RepID=A0A4D6YLK7_9GAMM|nr:assimilatory sulfite reductase (NADPH) flavoprotein subunit [Buchnera aphidicola]QCI26854.1 assimilatory sulfite reductase (NADPH) flavoprotein subunit [Buchnera aphidicola (Thelaxes californica)]
MIKKIDDLSVYPFTDEQIKLLNSFTNKLTSNQCTWLSGFFCGLSQKKIILKKTGEEKKSLINKKNNNHITIISASQTGNARSLSEKLERKCLHYNIPVKLFNAHEYKFKKINSEKILILIISTHGEGEPPEIALPMYHFLTSKKITYLKNLQYCIFGLGDSSYEHFCQAGKTFDKIFFDAGAKPLLERIDADVNYEEISNQWCTNLIQIIQKKFFFETSNQTLDKCTSNNQQNQLNHSIWSKVNPYLSTLLTNQKITGRYSNKDVRHLELHIKDSEIQYNPGDSVGIWYENDDSLINEILEILKIKKNEIVNIKNIQKTIFHALKFDYELTTNSSVIFKKYSFLSKDPHLINMNNDIKFLQSYIKNMPLVHMFRQFPTCLSAQNLIELLHPLKPRFYSISSSQLENNEEIHITVNVVHNICSGKKYLGGASGYLSKTIPDVSKIKIFIEKNNNFKLPINNNIPIIMIGSGTGIAPFRSFIQERDNRNALGKNWLFFGNQQSSEDFLYQQEWQLYHKQGLLNNIDLAWSQDFDHKIYIQEKMLEKSEELWKWIYNDEAYIYVCGNATNMAKDVELALIKIICQYNGTNTEQSNDFLNMLRTSKRYQRDIY